MIWLASYPRSGLTFLRHCLERAYGVPTLSRYPEPAAAETGEGIARNREPYPLDDGTDLSPLFCKTHWPSDAASPGQAVLLLRDGRDCIVSHAHYMVWTGCEAGFDYIVDALIDGRAAQSGQIWNWSHMTTAWLGRPGTVSIKFEDLIADPIGTVDGIARGVGIPIRGGWAPESFEAMKSRNPNFYRAGRSGQWRDAFSDEQVNRFDERHGGAMIAAGYGETASVASERREVAWAS